MRLRSCLAVPALLAALVVSGCSSGNSGGSAKYNSGGGSSAGRQPVAYAPPPAPSGARSGRGNTAYIIMTNSCGYCTKLKNNTLPDGNVRAELSTLNAQQVYADNASGRAIASRYGVTGYPTTVVVDPSGAVVKKIVGYYPPNDYAAQLRQAH